MTNAWRSLVTLWKNKGLVSKHNHVLCLSPLCSIHIKRSTETKFLTFPSKRCAHLGNILTLIKVLVLTGWLWFYACTTLASVPSIISYCFMSQCFEFLMVHSLCSMQVAWFGMCHVVPHFCHLGRSSTFPVHNPVTYQGSSVTIGPKWHSTSRPTCCIMKYWKRHKYQ